MLRYKINKKNANRTFSNLEINEPFLESEDILFLNITGSTILKEGDDIVLSRIEEDDINFYEEKYVKGVEENSGITTFTIEGFKNLTLNVDSIFIETKEYKPLLGISQLYLCFHIKKEYEHFLYENRNGKIKELLPEVYNEEIIDETIKRCPNDLVVYNDYFLYSGVSINDYGRFSSFSDLLNKKDGTIIIYPNNTLRNFLVELDKNGNNWEYDKENDILYLYECITPSLTTGKDNRNLLLWRISNSNLASIIEDNISDLLFYTKDERFIKESGETSENGLNFVLQPNTIISKKDYSISISSLFQEDFSTNLIQEELLTENYVEETKEKKKNKIIDYEKQIFEPVFFDNDTRITISESVHEIEFTLNFRDRNGEYEEWKTNNDLAWNNYKINGSKLSGKTNYFKYSDLLGYLGFTDNDVYYRKKKLSKSFLRLSFYDSKNRANQKLLFTSTIFVNDADLFSNYMKKIKNNVAPGDSGYVFIDTGEDRLDITFKCKGKFFNEISNNYNNNASSEGFYLYLFPTILDDSYEGEIYMKAEFNHAKYGYTIPFTLPVNDEGKVINPTGETFPVNYIESDDSGQTYANMNKLFNDMYITILLKYDSDNNRYVWGIKNAINENNIMKLRLFEPKING